MNAIIFEKTTKKIIAYIPKVRSYSETEVYGKGNIVGLNLNNVAILLTKHTVSIERPREETIMYNPKYLPKEWLNDEYKINLLE